MITNLSSAISFAITISNVVLAILTLYSNSKNTTNRRFFYFLFAVAFWVLSLEVFYSSRNESTLLLLGRINFSAGILLSFTLINFSSIYASTTDFLNKNTRIAAIIFSLAFILITIFTPLVSKNEVIVNDEIVTEFGSLFFLYIVFVVGGLLGSLVVLIKKYQRSYAVNKQLLKELFLVLVISLTWGIITNVLLPFVFNVFTFQLLGPLGSLLFSAFVSYSIIRHQFLEVRVLFGKIIYYTLLAIPPFFMFFAVAYLYQTAFGGVFTLNSYLVGVPVAYMFVALFTFITGYAKKYTDTRLINPGYDPLEVIDELNRSVSNQLDIETISEKALEIVARTIRPEFQGIFVIPEEGPWLGFTYKEQQQPHPDDFRLIMSVWDERNKGPLNYDELEAKLSGNYTQAPQLMTEVLRVMKMYNLKAIFPLLQQERIAGMLLLGKKEADYPYSIQDTGFLNSIARTISLTVGRALLYEEIQQFNIELQAKVAKATLELKTKNANLEDALRKLEEARRQERDMVDVMGHELRTPLSIVRNAVVVLKEQKDRDGVIPDEKLTKYLNMAAESIRREVGLVETLLTTTKLDSSRIQMDMTKVSLKEVVHDSLLGHQQSADNKKIKIEYDENAADVLVYADRTRIQEITDNFLSNAIKYTNEGSVKIAISQDDKTGSISITDTGVGISADDIANLGKKFFRARALYNEDNKYAHPSGTGLGLFVAFELIRIMDGERVITSVPGQGSTFAFKLPLFTSQPDKHIDQTFMGDPEVETTKEVPTPTSPVPAS